MGTGSVSAGTASRDATPRRTGSRFTRSTWRSTRGRSSATSKPGTHDERILLPLDHHGARSLGRGGHHPGRPDRRLAHPDHRGAAARDRERGHPPDHLDSHAAAYGAHARALHPRGERHLALARGMGAPGVPHRRAGRRHPRLQRRRPHRLVRLGVRGRLGPHRAVSPDRSEGASRRLMERVFVAVGGASAFIAVAAGAFGAHALRSRMSPQLLAAFATGARYQMYHALALLAVACALTRWPVPAVRAAGWLFVAGTLIFSRAPYLLAPPGVGIFGAGTPPGGVRVLPRLPPPPGGGGRSCAPPPLKPPT